MTLIIDDSMPSCFPMVFGKSCSARSALSRACLIFAIEFLCPAQTVVDCSLGQFYKGALLQNVEDCYF